MTAKAVLREVHEMRRRIQEVAYGVRSGALRGLTGEAFTGVLVIGLSCSLAGPEAVAQALRADPAAAAAAGGSGGRTNDDDGDDDESEGSTSSDQKPRRTLRFLSNTDPVDFHVQTVDLDPASTLVIVVSELIQGSVLLNARTARRWLWRGMSRQDATITEQQVAAHHMWAITGQQQPPGAGAAPTNAAAAAAAAGTHRCRQFGIATENIFALPVWVNQRFSVSSAVGLLPLSLQYSYPVMSDFLEGCHDMDEHFFHAPLRENIPVIMGLLGVWNSTFLGYGCRAVLPYSTAMSKFPAYVQLVSMESNGKRVALDGTPLLHASGEIEFGGSGTDAQHSFFQLLHQGRVVPAEFIGFMESQQPVDLPGEAVSNHDELMSSFFAQPDALAYGKTLVDLIQEGTSERLREHMVHTGNRPSSSLLMTRLDAFSIGQLVSMYEHRTAVQGFIWGINSFDHFGTQLGDTLAKHVRAQLAASRKTGASVQGFNASTSTLLEHYLAHGKQQQQGDGSTTIIMD
jgi:glucose-6-phosphate isomerase